MHYSARARSIFGFPPDIPITFELVRDATHPEDLPWTLAQAQRALDPAIKQKTPFEYRIIRADNGETRWVLAHGEALFVNTDAGQMALRYIGTVQDITERKAVEQALRESELRQRLAIDAARMAVWELDVATERITTSPELNRMFGLPLDAKPTIEDLRALYGPGEREKVQEAVRTALAQGETRFEAEFRCRRPDGDLYWLLLRAEVLGLDCGWALHRMAYEPATDVCSRSPPRSQRTILRATAGLPGPSTARQGAATAVQPSP